MTPNCLAALVSWRRLATLRRDDGRLTTPRVAPQRTRKLEVLVGGGSSPGGTCRWMSSSIREDMSLLKNETKINLIYK